MTGAHPCRNELVFCVIWAAGVSNTNARFPNLHGATCTVNAYRFGFLGRSKTQYIIQGVIQKDPMQDNGTRTRQDRHDDDDLDLIIHPHIFST